MIANPPPIDISRYYIWAAVAASLKLKNGIFPFGTLLVISILRFLNRNLRLLKPFQCAMIGLAIMLFPGAL